MTVLSPRIQEFLTGTKQLFINGEFVDAQSEKTFPSINPATGEVLALIQEAGAADADRAVLAAHKAFEEGPWSRMTGVERGKLLNRLADLMEQNKVELAQLETLDNGKPIRETTNADVPLAFEHIRYYAGWASKITGQTIPVNGNFFNFTLHEPVGVVAQIIPWNFPLLMAAWKLGASLATGCTVVLKPASYTPLTALYIAKLVQEAGFPAGVVNVIPGPGGRLGDALVKHPLVNKVAFTGSTDVGRGIMKSAAESIKRVTLELGGKSPNIIMPDADLSRAVPGALMGIMFNQGQVCCAGSRLFVQKKSYDNVVADLAALTKKIRLGNGLESDTEMGPVVSGQQQQTVMSFIDKGVAEGAELVAGGVTAYDKGYFIAPTVFANVDSHMTIAKEEIFGPVVAAMPFDDLDDVIRRANDSEYGLAAGLWTQDLRTAHYVAGRLKAGTVWVNCYNAFDAAAPFGGYKQSGIGREMGSYALHNYTEVKDVWISLD